MSLAEIWELLMMIAQKCHYYLKFYQEKCEEFLHNPPWMGNVFDGPDDGLLHLANTAWELIKIIWHFF